MTRRPLQRLARPGGHFSPTRTNVLTSSYSPLTSASASTRCVTRAASNGPFKRLLSACASKNWSTTPPVSASLTGLYVVVPSAERTAKKYFLLAGGRLARHEYLALKSIPSRPSTTCGWATQSASNKG